MPHEPTGGRSASAARRCVRLASVALRALRRDMQMVFQDPESSLDPRMTAGALSKRGWSSTAWHACGSPVADAGAFRHGGARRGDARTLPHEFSGGQRQRIGIARALALAPSLLVRRAVSALDLSVQAQVVNLLLDLQQKLGLTLLLVAHDLRLVRHLSSRLAVMYRGRIVETGRTTRCSTRRPCLHPRPAVGRARCRGGGPPDRLRFDHAAFDPGLELREVAPGHWAAVTGSGPNERHLPGLVPKLRRHGPPASAETSRGLDDAARVASDPRVVCAPSSR